MRVCSIGLDLGGQENYSIPLSLDEASYLSSVLEDSADHIFIIDLKWRVFVE